MGGLTETCSYDAGDKLTHVQWFEGSKSFEYDGLGRRTSQTDATGTTTYTWDHQSRLASVSRPGSPTNSFAYNALGARVSSVSSAGSQTFQRDGAFVTDPVISDSGATYTPGISERRAGTSTFQHSGIKNADSRTVSSSGIAASRTYDAFGNLVSSTGTWQGPFGYGGAFGYQEGGDYGLKLLGHRYLDSTTGSFLSRDLLDFERNRYAYCGSNPLAFADANGLLRNSVQLSPMAVELVAEDIITAEALGGGISLPKWVTATLIFLGLLEASNIDVEEEDSSGDPPEGGEEPYLYRYGQYPESQKRLAGQAKQAEAAGRPYGVSVNLRPRPDSRRARISDVQRHFAVIQTGMDLNHFTLVFPKPLTAEDAKLFNDLFQPRVRSHASLGGVGQGRNWENIR